MEYNVFADKWLNSNVLSSSVFTKLSDTYQRRLGEAVPWSGDIALSDFWLAPYGVPIDSRDSFTKPGVFDSPSVVLQSLTD